MQERYGDGSQLVVEGIEIELELDRWLYDVDGEWL